MKLLRITASWGAIMSRLSFLLGLAAAMLVALPATGVAAPTVDLTELARAAKAITATASSSPSDGKYR